MYIRKTCLYRQPEGKSGTFHSQFSSSENSHQKTKEGTTLIKYKPRLEEDDSGCEVGAIPVSLSRADTGWIAIHLVVYCFVPEA
jgi:V8-like Glu-specific endopeptidase